MSENSKLDAKFPIQHSVEILFLAVVFHAIIRIPYYNNITSIILGILVLFSSCNAWLTARAEFGNFKTIWFVFDLLIIFFYAVMPILLLSPNKMWGYSVVFWLMFAGTEVVYTAWNILFSNSLKIDDSSTQETIDLKNNMKKWIKFSSFAVFLFLSIFFYLEYFDPASFFNMKFNSMEDSSKLFGFDSQFVGHILMIIGGMYMFGMEVVWNILRYKSEVSTGHHFLIE